jgi:hypothetical protein
MAENQNRCWPGYEPVEGKRPNSQGSCRPKTESKLTDSEKEFRAQRKRQLKKWQADHPGTHEPAQHLHAPGAKAKKSNAKTSKPSSAAKSKTAGSRGKKGK